MDAISRKVKRTESEWREIVEAAERSGMTRSGYCRAQGIDYEQFLYHRRKLLTKGAEKLATLQSRSSMVAAGDVRDAFIPIEVGRRSPSAVSGRGGIRLHFPCGLTLSSDEVPPAGWLVEVAARWESAGGVSC